MYNNPITHLSVLRGSVPQPPLPASAPPRAALRPPPSAAHFARALMLGLLARAFPPRVLKPPRPSAAAPPDFCLHPVRRFIWFLFRDFAYKMGGRGRDERPSRAARCGISPTRCIVAQRGGALFGLSAFLGSCARRGHPGRFSLPPPAPLSTGSNPRIRK